MTNRKMFMVLLFILLQISLPLTGARNIVCYYVGLNGIKLIPPENLNPRLCTHINYAFVKITESGNLTYLSKNVDVNKNMYKRVIDLKLQNPELKVLLSVGGTAAGIFSDVMADSDKMETFVKSCEEFINVYSFDGIDLDWEKPLKADEVNLVTVLKGLREAFDRKSWLLSMAVYPNPSAGYDAKKISKYVDIINIMTYNYYMPSGERTGQNSPLYSSSLDSGYEKRHLNVAVSVKNWIEAGALKDKIHVGFPFYGRTFTLKDSNEHGLHAPTNGSSSTLPYGKICRYYNNWTTVWDDEQKNPYKYHENQWLGYDDERSIREKARFVMSENLGGAMIWHLGADDFDGNCGKKQGLLQVINDEFNENS